VRVLAKLGLVTAAAATILFIFIYEFQGPVINRVMSQPPPRVQTEEPIAKVEKLAPEAAETKELPEKMEEEPIEVEEPVEPAPTPTTAPEVAPESPKEEAAKEEVIEPEVVEAPVGPTRRVYGKITLATSGEQLGGVNIMVPGSTVAKISNPNGGYTIEVPMNARELIFIYRGKKLIKPINSGNTLINVVLDLESMQYD
jgi:hypothetical protein